MALELREERPADVGAIHAVERAAFPTDAEARLVDALRSAGALTLSLVALEGASLVGHVAFSPVTIRSLTGAETVALGLGPMAVAPSHQRTGVGTRLISRALELLTERRHALCVVLGHPTYYPRHGFVPAAPLRWEHGHDHAFFAKELMPGALDAFRAGGVVRYRPEFMLGAA